jgi:DNA-directed RNA polymerase specialized sigma24 family protein
MIEHIFSPLPPNSCGGSWSIMLVASEAKKGGGGKVCATPFDSDQAAWPLDERLLAVDEALAKLETLDRRAAKVIKLRFFGGLTETEAAEALEISTTTLKRDWDFARSWLATQLG